MLEDKLCLMYKVTVCVHKVRYTSVYRKGKFLDYVMQDKNSLGYSSAHFLSTTYGCPSLSCAGLESNAATTSSQHASPPIARKYCSFIKEVLSVQYICIP